MRIIRCEQSWWILAARPVGKLCLQRLALKYGYRVGVICDELGCSERYFQTVFLRDIGLPPKIWMRQERMVVARRKLMGGKSPAQVSCDLGFSSLGNFRRDFLRFYGVSPLQFQAERQLAPAGMAFECL